MRTTDADFEALTEGWGMPMPPEQAAMARTRYEFAARHAGRGPLLELACGTGFGVDFLLEDGRRVVGGDIASGNLEQAHARVPGGDFVRLDAHRLPFAAGRFSAVVIFEALYYFEDVRR